MDNNFNNILKEFRTKHKLTQPEMSVILGISLRMYQLYESNSFTGSENKKSKYIAKLTSWEIKKDESNKHEISFVNEPNENYGTKAPPSREEDLLLVIKNLEARVKDKEEIISLMRDKISKAETIEKLFISALHSPRTLKEFHSLIESSFV